MTTPSLEGCWAKLRRAEHHLTNLRGEVKAFEESHDFSITVEVDPDAGKYSFYVGGLQSPKDHWGLMVGDCVHNARSALDYLAGRLVSLATGADPAKQTETAFPIYSDSGRFKGAIANMLKGIQPGYKAVIEALQPFNASDTSIWGAEEGCTPSALPTLLGQLADLDDIDKHRVIHATWNRMDIVLTSPELPPDFTLLFPMRVMSPLEDGTKIAEWNFRTPLPDPGWRPSEVEMKRCFPINIGLENWAPAFPIYDHLARYVIAVRAVLTIFEPVFSQGQPPLRPVDVMPLRFAET